MSSTIPTDPALPPSPSPGGVLLADTQFAFRPIAFERVRGDGWTPAVQAAFIEALSVMGSVGMAARAVGVGRQSAYRLRTRALRAGAAGASFIAAWDAAQGSGRWRQYAVAMERAVDGHTIVRVHRGGSVSVTGGPDLRIMNAALREAPRAVPAATSKGGA